MVWIWYSIQQKPWSSTNVVQLYPFRGNWAPVMEWRGANISDPVDMKYLENRTIPNHNVTYTLTVPFHLIQLPYTCTTKFIASMRPTSTDAGNIPDYAFAWTSPGTDLFGQYIKHQHSWNSSQTTCTYSDTANVMTRSVSYYPRLCIFNVALPKCFVRELKSNWDLAGWYFSVLISVWGEFFSVLTKRNQFWSRSSYWFK